MKKHRPQARRSSNEEARLRLVRTTNPEVITRLNKPVQQLHNTLYPKLFKPFDEATVEAFFRMAIQKEQSHFVVCYKGDVAIGYTWYEDIERKENALSYTKRYVHIHQISVNEDYRRRGVGRKLFNSALAYAKEHAIKRVGLDYWVKNRRAKEIYAYYRLKVEREIAFIEL